MGLFKKIFKPVSKVLDKIIPNEIKPALPYLSAFAPYMLGPGAAAGSWWQKALYNPALRAGIMGGTNIGAQLAQEGSEGDINALSAGLAALQGFGTAGGATSTLEGFKSPMTDFDPARSGIMKFKDKLLDYGITGANKLQSAGDLLGAGGVEPGLNLATLEAAALPAAQATGDVMYAQGKRDLKDLANEVVDDMGGGYSDDAYRAAIRKSMEAYGATEEEILESIIAAGYRSGGRVGFSFGGIGAAVENVDNVEMKETMKLAQDMDMPIEDIVEEFMIIHKRKPNSLQELKMFYRDKYKWKGPADVKMQETVKETFTAKDGGTPSVLPKGVEADYRGGGFIPIGSKERADDVPARLSENEFVMTADAVRAAGGGNVNKGAQRMYNVMNNLEARA